ncbi:MAG: DUF3788 family protein [Bacteroidales bacterium]|jgi:hypothetical protein|nr:DUF3788 domain-containing protein [Bacteroidales bacterium]MDD4215266.1 DUF3788 family protein [Bacteroidales bacterium]
MALSIFDDKSAPPDEKMLEKALLKSMGWWNEIKDFVISNYPNAVEEWKHSGKNWGWGFRLKDKKRVIIYLTPQDKYFLFAMVFGEKATLEVLKSKVSEEIKKTLSEARVYVEGRGIRMEVNSSKIISDIKNLILIKLTS